MPRLTFDDAFRLYHEYCSVLAEGIRQLADERGFGYDDDGMMPTAVAATDVTWQRNNPTGYPYIQHAQRWLDKRWPGVKEAMWALTLRHVEQGGAPDKLRLSSSEAMVLGDLFAGR